MTDERISLVMPQLGNGVEDAVVVEWLIAIGEGVTEGTPVVLVESDKAQTELNAPVTGTLVEVVADDEAEIAVGDVLAWFNLGAST